MSSLCSWPGTRRWTCGSTNAGRRWRPRASTTSASGDAPRRADLRDAPVADEDVVRAVDARARVEDVGRGDQDLGGRGGRLDERARGVEGAARAHAIDGSAVGAGTFALPARTS